MPRGSLGDPQRQHEVPISGHHSIHDYFFVHPDEPARTLRHTVEWTAPWISFVYFLGWVYLGLTVRFTLLLCMGRPDV